ncbi:fructosamine kinase family protein [Muriicola sp. Z0-33]|uniref:fructosamine kinase family protein n=1 Tax=Muriicola sp. Z0-33 TaxID=2816957 RepID=UPI0022380AA6|nr:fructosamine kinase family protein [Muriicola sp. Z0-33]MCW5514693.1 fructosamine kinase family protein [Muriicola sp. Z0-33]
MQKDTEFELAGLLGNKIVGVKPISGGDISKAYLLELPKSKVFCKLNYSKFAYSLFEQELTGLNLIADSGAIKAPEVIGCSRLERGACLLLEYIVPGNPTAAVMQKFGYQLAELHLCGSEYFGLEEDNYIGSLPQSNSKHNNWANFYARERLHHQLQLALEKKLLRAEEVPDVQTLESVIEKYTGGAMPGLLHGDLWGGNYLISSRGDPYLIDPAVYYGHHEVDIAMTKLFGGFDNAFYQAYHEIIPQSERFVERQDLYQLYYLLVHLNLFGSSYYPAVINCIKNYF